jgi:hypothetical protein
MFNTTNIYNLNESAGQPSDPRVDAWTKVAAVATVMTMLLTALLLTFTIMASQRPTLVVRYVTIPTPVLIQQPRPAPADHHAVLNAILLTAACAGRYGSRA